MKSKLCLLPMFALCACATSTDSGNGLNRLYKEPKNCEYLYTLDSNVTMYKIANAYDYIEKTILDQKIIGDSYYVVNEDVNKESFLEPDNFKFKVKVYNCNK